ncbi:MAG: hypothetical protein NZP74_15555 [Anaerolineales bacterium]|nr:hypothetical protein [Anaerolineales bacterium]MDW8277082.1 hypothetical protein [Anaerolineales bacterium]
MKKSILFLASVLTTIAMLFALPAIPAAAAGEKSIKIFSAHFIPGKGTVFVFDVKGNFDSFGGSVTVAGKTYPLHCNFRDDGKLSCVASDGGKSIGKTVFGSVNGFSFTTKVAPVCYSIFDFDTSLVWVEAGVICQETATQEGDIIEWYNPLWGDTYLYIYSLDGSDSPWLPPNFGRGYYWWY